MKQRVITGVLFAIIFIVAILFIKILLVFHIYTSILNNNILPDDFILCADSGFDIANEAGVNIGLIRYHFGHKADLYRDTLAYISEQYNAVCTAALQKAKATDNPEEIIYA